MKRESILSKSISQRRELFQWMTQFLLLYPQLGPSQDREEDYVNTSCPSLTSSVYF